jgi:hypothetical protein
LEDELLPERIAGLVAVLDRHEGVDSLACELVRDTDDGGFCDGVVLDKGGFNFCRGQTMATDVNNIVDTSADPVEALMVTAGTVSRELRWCISIGGTVNG